MATGRKADQSKQVERKAVVGHREKRRETHQRFANGAFDFLRL